MDKLAIGVDICDVRRIKKIILRHQDRFLEKVFTEKEIGYCGIKARKYESYAARFAAKEALMKALGLGLRQGIHWKDIEIQNDALGKPFFIFYGKTLDLINNRAVQLSLSHTTDNAIAFVIISDDRKK